MDGWSRGFSLIGPRAFGRVSIADLGGGVMRSVMARSIWCASHRSAVSARVCPIWCRSWRPADRLTCRGHVHPLRETTYQPSTDRESRAGTGGRRQDREGERGRIAHGTVARATSSTSRNLHQGARPCQRPLSSSLSFLPLHFSFGDYSYLTAFIGGFSSINGSDTRTFLPTLLSGKSLCLCNVGIEG